VQGDLAGIVAQAITDGTDDISPAPTPDATHYKYDHNYYQQFPSLAGGAFVTGQTYQILTVGTTDFTAIGAAANTVGTVFTATGAGSGSGTAQAVADLRTAKRYGFQEVFAQKHWFGCPGFLDADTCSPSASNTPCGTHYLTATYAGSFSTTTFNPGYSGYDITGAPATTDETITTASSLSGSRSFGRYTGTYSNNVVVTNHATRGYSADLYTAFGEPRYKAGTYTMLDVSNTVGTQIYAGEHVNPDWSVYSAPITGYDVGSSKMGADVLTDVHCSTDVPSIANLISIWNLNLYIFTGANASGTWNNVANTGSANSYTMAATGQATGASVSTFAGTFLRTNDTYSITITIRAYALRGGVDTLVSSTDYSFSCTLSDSYTAAQCYADYEALHNEFDMSDPTLAKFRQDEKLALAPLVIRDEYVGVRSPVGFFPFDQDDYRLPITDVNGNAPWTLAANPGQHGTALPLNDDIYGGDDIGSGASPPNSASWLAAPRYDGVAVNWIPTFTQMPYTDPSGSAWKYDGKNTQPVWPSASWSSATLNTAIYSGNPVAHSQSGSGKHFWFKAEVWVRVPGSGVGGAPPYTWNRVAIGAFSDPLLPDVAVRWLPKPAAQYDPLSTNVSPAPPGVFPQAWWSQNNGVIIGGKFVQATQKWPAQKFCRPCGKDKYAVAQTTVCCITSGTVPNLVIKPTANATAPLAMGGLAVNDFIIIEGDGVYKITALTASGGAWNCTVGTRIDTLPTGWHFTDPDQAADGSVHLGRIRWLNYSQYGTTFTSAPGIELRVGVTTSYAAGVLTVTTSAAQPYLRVDPTTGTPAIRTVSLYDSSMTLLVSGLVLARTDDSHFTVTASNYPTAAYMMDTQFATAISAGPTTDWTLYDGTSKQTGLQMTWTFDQRSGHLATGSQPAWIGGSGAGTGTGLVGALAAGYSVSQFNYSAGACPSVVGMVPSSPTIENFPVQNLFVMPAFSNFDDVYGQHGQSAIQLTSQDALWEPPYKPDGGGAISFSWVEDNGSGESDGTSAIYGVQKFYAHHPLVEALDAIPAGLPTGALPTGIHLPYDASAVVVAPPFYPNGIPISTDTTAGDYADVETDWGFALNACGNVGGRFSSSYAYVSC
jgi:hypothetical protein